MLTSAKALILMGVIYISASLMLGAHLFIGSALICFICIILRILSATNKIAPISRTSIRILTILGIVLLLFHAVHPLRLADGFINLLLLGCALKFLEYGNKRDLYVQSVALFFLSIVPLIFHYEFYILAYLVILPMLVIWNFIAITHNDNIGQDLKLLLKLVLPAIPLTIALFIVFPRFGALWVMPNSSTAITGISDEMNINSISKLTRSDAVIARIKFKGSIPKERYFQAMVYESYNGQFWRPSNKTKRTINTLSYARYIPNAKGQPSDYRDTVDYDLMLEPNGTTYIPTLKYSSTDDRNIYYIDGDIYLNSIPTQTRELYHFSYYPQLTPTIEFQESRELLYLPKNQNPKTQKLVQELTQKADSDTDKLMIIFNYFSNNFSYTLNPGFFGSNAVDELLFSTKKGFCAHYASAMAIMLRMAKIPSRVVAGYLGGTNNGDYIILHEYDAHAWVEAYVDNRWQRFDPTSLVAPERISSELTLTSQNYEGGSIFLPRGLNKLIKEAYEFATFNWSMWILNFSSSEQSNLFKGRILAFFGTLLAGIVFFGTALYFLLHYKAKIKIPKEKQYLNQIITMLTKRNYPIDEGETLENYSLRLKDSPYYEICNQAFMIYSSLRYTKCSIKEREKGLKLMKNYVLKLKNL